MTPTSSCMLRIALLNPNTDTRATELMLDSARPALSAGATIEGRTAPRGELMIVNERALHAAAPGIVEMGLQAQADGFDALIVSGFGDPGLEALRATVSVPVLGIAEAGIAAAGAAGRRYSIVTVTHELHDSLRMSTERYGFQQNLASIRFTQGEPLGLVQDAQHLQDALLQTCQSAMHDDGAQAIVIGGGPLARAANAIALQLPIPVIEPVAAAVRQICRSWAAMRKLT